jgi:hypothetical protein
MSTSPWIEGVIDAIGFIVGALIGFGVGQLLGFDLFSAGYGTASIVGILMVGVGGGAGVQVARALKARRRR